MNRYIIIILIMLLFITGCSRIILSTSNDNIEGNLNQNVLPEGYILIESDKEITKDCTPELNIICEGAAYMSFSGDGKIWTDWVEYKFVYDNFNIANNLYGTEFGSGLKYVFVRFKDESGNLSPSDKIAFDTVEYEMGELFSIKIIPQKINIPTGGSYQFSLHGYDLILNEVPLLNDKVTWTKCCGVGELNPKTGLTSTYTAPLVVGRRDISAHYENLTAGAIIDVFK